jgi:hypothetical protein
VVESTLKNLVPYLEKNSLHFKAEPNGEWRLQPANRNLEQTNLEDTMILNVLHIPQLAEGTMADL